MLNARNWFCPCRISRVKTATSSAARRRISRDSRTSSTWFVAFHTIAIRVFQFTVPAGFAITTTAFNRHLELNSAIKKAVMRLQSGDE